MSDIEHNSPEESGMIQKRTGGDRVFFWIKLAIALVFLLYVLINPQVALSKHMFSRKFFFRAGFLGLFWGLSVAIIILQPYYKEITVKIRSRITVFYLLATPFFTFITMESVLTTEFNPLTMAKRSILYDLLAIVVIEIVLIVLTNSVTAGPRICITICVVFSIVNYFVYDFRGIPFLTTDITTVTTALSVAGEYTLNFTYKVCRGIILLFFYLMIGGTLDKQKLFSQKRQRGITAAVAVVIFCLFGYGYIHSPYLTGDAVYLKLFQPIETYRKHGTFVTLCKSTQFLFVAEPEGYSPEAAAEIAASYSSDSAATAGERPNLIVMINESLADLAVLGDVETNEDYMPYLHSLSDHCVTGTTYASVVGGGTANTEFEFLTNDSLAFLPSQAVVFQLYLRTSQPSLATSAEQMGYIGNFAFHPWKGTNYNRDKVYPLLGFEDFISLSDLGSDVSYLRDYPSDAFATDEIIQTYEQYRKTTNEPFFSYTLTMQNHSPYDYQESDDASYKEDITLSNYDYEEVQQYLNLVQYSDEAFKDLVTYFDGVDEPTIFLIMGDHQPRLSDQFLNDATDDAYNNWDSEEMMTRYAVPFVICANYDLETKKIDRTSMNFMQTIFLEASGDALTGYQKFLQDFMEEVPVLTANGYWGADGNFYLVDDETSPYYELLQEYAILQYNTLFDSENRIPDFFYLKD